VEEEDNNNNNNNGGEDNTEVESTNISAPATEEVMKTRRKLADRDSTPNSETTQNGESVKKDETPPPPISSSTFGTPTFGTTSTFGKPTFGSNTPPFSFGTSSTFPSIFSFGSNASTTNTTSTTSPSPETTLSPTTEKPFAFGFSSTSFSFGPFGGDFKFPSFTQFSSFNTIDADKTREATTNASTSWSTDFSVTETGDSSPQSNVKLSKLEKPTTGEEGETTLSEARVRLFEFEKSNWKERGLGTIKINTDQTKYRLLMRTDTTLKVILNAGIYNDMTSEEQSEKQLRFACVNSIVSEETPNPKISNFIIKFQTKQAFEDFFKALQSAKIAAGPLKKASGKEEHIISTTTENEQEEITTNQEKTESKEEKAQETTKPEEKEKDEN